MCVCVYMCVCVCVCVVNRAISWPKFIIDVICNQEKWKCSAFSWNLNWAMAARANHMGIIKQFNSDVKCSTSHMNSRQFDRHSDFQWLPQTTAVTTLGKSLRHFRQRLHRKCYIRFTPLNLILYLYIYLLFLIRSLFSFSFFFHSFFLFISY